MAVTEALMSLFLKEMFTLDKVMGVCKRFKNMAALTDVDNLPTDQEEALLYWLSKSSEVLKSRTQEEVKVLYIDQ